ncbi:Rho guanine nucleotide exchange factor 26 [Boothiomyces macroporosus]|uniref:Rho guanine nucleotide exchange factor 26 n=1 Tax=Boothiomyces macroporosus TaxID=261099 RepID=A0AAD5UAF5_9FUNG|nr:Rho guanine nucleotide exchange factor 26 [Boothiomyces macroporosus]
MDRNRARSASPLLQLRNVAKSTNALAKSPSPLIESTSRETLEAVPRTQKTSNSMGNIKEMESGSAMGSTVSIHQSQQSVESDKITATSRFSIQPSKILTTSKSTEATSEVSSPLKTSNSDYLTIPSTSWIVRTRSSYAIHFSYLNDLKFKQFSQSILSIDAPDSASSRERINSHQPGAMSTDSLNLLGEEGFLKEIEIKGFTGIWNHSITRLDVQEFRNGFHKFPNPATRLNAFRRIRKQYFHPSSPFFVIWPTDIVEPTINEVLDKLAANGEQPDITIFDDLGYLAMQSMERAYLGLFNPQTEKDDDKVYEYPKFKASAFHQILRNDLHGTSNLTSIQYTRAIERVTDMLTVLQVEVSKCEAIYGILEVIALDMDNIVLRQPKPLKKPPQPTKSTLNLADDSMAQSVVTRGTLRNAASAMWTANDPSSTHTFLPDTSEGSKYCEYCFQISEGDDSSSIYRCETCGFYCHKSCRNQVRLTCIKTSNDGDIQSLVQESDRIRLVQEKLAALQREVDIELKIQEGLSKLTKAKYDRRKGKKSAAEKDIIAQLERNNKRLEILKHEMQKRMVQLQKLKTPVTAPLENKANLSASISMNGLNNPDLSDTGLLKVIVVDSETKSEYKKAIYISENKSTVQVIEMILEKSNINGKAEDFQLTYKNDKNETVVLKNEDRPMQIEDLDYAETTFLLKAHAHHDSKLDKVDTTTKKQREIIDEIVELDQKYLEDLKLIQTVFYDPLESSELLSHTVKNDLFHNLADIISMHDKINKILENQKTLEQLISCFQDAVPDFHCYKEYVSNQYKQRRTLEKMKSDPLFLKLLQKCESNPKLRKLSFSDMLMKPMQKITRYPLLFKRLLPTMVQGSQNYKSLTKLLTDIEKIIEQVNGTIKKMEAQARIRQIDENLNFGVVCEKFKLLTDERELIQEKPLQYLSKNGAPIDVTLILFNDLILIVRKSKKSESMIMLFKQPIPLEGAIFVDKIDSESKKYFQIAHYQQEVHTFLAHSTFDKNSLLQEAESARNRFCMQLVEMEMAHVRFQSSKYQMISPILDATSVQPSIIQYFKNRIYSDITESPQQEETLSRKNTREGVNPIKPEDLKEQKNRLSQVPRQSFLKLSKSFRNITGSSANLTESSNNLMDKLKKGFK